MRPRLECGPAVLPIRSADQCGCTLRQAMSGKSGRRSPRSQREMFRKIHACAMELLAKLGHSYVISALSREPLFSISEDREVVCKEGEQLGHNMSPFLCESVWGMRGSRNHTSVVKFV